VVGVINVNQGSLTDVNELLDEPEVDAVLYKDYSPYHGRHGAISWHNGKPCLSYKFSLWENMKGASPQELADQIAKLPADPTSDAGSYALITVHAWSFGNIGGPLTAIKQTIDLLPPGTRVVTAPELVGWLKRYIGPKQK
jgi:acyl-CoA-binding protein